MDGLNVAVGSCVGISDGVFVGSSNDGVSVGETQTNEKVNCNSEYITSRWRV